MHNEDIYARPTGPEASRFAPPTTIKKTHLELLESASPEGRAPMTPPSPREASPASTPFAHFDTAGSNETPIAEIMSKKVFCAASDMPLDVLAYIMLDQEMGATPVVDTNGRPVGVISKTDLLREIRNLSDVARASWDPWRVEDEASPAVLNLEQLGMRQAQDAMTPIVYWLPEDASIAQASALMAYEHVQTIPVINKLGHISGMVSTLDILRWFARRQGYLIPR